MYALDAMASAARGSLKAMQGVHSVTKTKNPPVHDRRATGVSHHAQAVTAIVDDPLGTIPGEKIAVTRAVRDDPLAGLHARHQIDDAMLMAGRYWQTQHENSEIGGISAIDPTKEAVDGGRIPEPITDRQMQAFKRLKAADLTLGYQGKVLVRAILGERLTIQQYAMRLGLCSEREFLYIGRRLRECLNDLAKLWGFA